MADSEDFAAFYQKFPRREARADAAKAWRQTAAVRPPLDVLLAAIERQRVELDWCRERRRFIPLPATWLRGERWADEFDVPEAVLPAKPATAVRGAGADAALEAAAMAAWVEVRQANACGSVPLLGWSDPRTAQALHAMGGMRVLADMGPRDAGFRQKEFMAAFRVVKLTADASNGSNVVPIRRVA